MKKLDLCIWFAFAMPIAFLVAYAGWLPPFVLTTTRYAPGCSEKQFQGMPLGTPEKQVRLTLGNPIFEYTNAAGDYTFMYSRQGSGWAMHFHSRMLCFSN